MMRLSVFSILVLCCAGTAFAVDQKSPSIVIDGRLDEPVWKSLPAENLIPSG